MSSVGDSHVMKAVVSLGSEDEDEDQDQDVGRAWVGSGSLSPLTISNVPPMVLASPCSCSHIVHVNKELTHGIDRSIDGLVGSLLSGHAGEEYLKAKVFFHRCEDHQQIYRCTYM